MKEVIWLDDESYRKQVVVNRETIENEAKKRTVEEKIIIIQSRYDDVYIKILHYTKPGYFEISQYVVYKKDKEIGRFYRNYTSYPQLFVEHSNGKLYFICGFNYQGYTIINITDEIMNHYLPGGAIKGCGWCPTEWRDYDPKTNTIIAEGCYWGASFDRREYDFSNPDVLPLPLLRESDLDPDPEEDDDDDDEDSEL